VIVRLIVRDALALSALEAEVGPVPKDLTVEMTTLGTVWDYWALHPEIVGGILRDGIAWKRA